MRALLVTNPKATATTPRVRDVIVNALSAQLDVELAHTTHRGHAMELGQRAAHEHVDLVIVLGGDGTVNEVVNGMLSGGPRADLPALAAVPGGSANVFARNLGLSNDPIDATGQLIEAIAAGRSRRISLGRIEGRWFVFTAGVGFDAGVVHGVELRRGDGRKASPVLYATTAIRDFYRGTHRRKTKLRIEIPGQEPITDAFLAIATNATPWTYYKDIAVHLTPETTFEGGLGLFALRKISSLGVGKLLWQVTRATPRPRSKAASIAHDLNEMEITCESPVPVQVDGDYAGDFDRVRIECVPQALTVIS